MAETIVLSGNVCGVSIVPTCRQVEKLAGTDVETVRLDLAGVRIMDSNALGALAYMRHLLDRRGKSLVLVAPPPLVSELFTTCGMDQLFEIVEPLPESVGEGTMGD